MRKKSAPTKEPIKHAGGSYNRWGPTPRYSASGDLEAVVHGLTGQGLLDGSWGQVHSPGSLVGVLNQLRGDEQIQTPYWQDPWIFACIYRIAEAASSARLRIYRDRSEESEPIDDADPLYELFRRPHPSLSYNRWLRHMVTLWWIYGETPLAMRMGMGTRWVPPGNVNLKTALNGGKRERLQLWPIKPDCAELRFDSDLNPEVWRIETTVSASGQRYVDIPAESVAHMFSPDPMDVMLTRGMGRLEAALRTADIDWSAERFAEADVRTGGVPNIVIAAKKGITPEAAKKLQEDIERKHQQPNKQGKSMVFSGQEYDVLFPGHTAKDMAWVELRRWNRETKIAVMGANPAWLGITDDVNRANGENGRRNVWEDTIGPFLEQYAGELENEVLPMLGERYAEYAIRFDTSHITALREDADKLAERTVKLFQGLPLTLQEAADLAGMDLPEGVQGAGERKPEPVAPAIPGDEPKPGEPKRQAFEILFDKDEHELGRAATWNTFAEQTADAEAKIKKHTVRIFFGYIDKAIALARDLASEGKSFAWDGTVRNDISEADLRMLLPDIAPWQERLADALIPRLADVLEQQARYIASSLGANVLVTRTDPFAVSALASKEIRIKETLVTLRDAVKSVLERSLLDGEAVGSAADQIRQVLELYRSDLKVMQDGLATRAEMIARTETTSIANSARVKEAEAQGVVEMRWITARDPQVRETHAAQDGQVRPVGQAFANGLRYPGDPEASSASEVVNCRCTVAPTARGAQARGGQAA